MYCKVIELIQSKDEGQNVFLHSLGIVSPHQSATSILVLWVETQENNKGAKVRVQIDQTKQILIKNIDQVSLRFFL